MDFQLLTDVDNDSADVTLAGKSFPICGLITGKARLATVVCLLGGTAKRLATYVYCEQFTYRSKSFYLPMNSCAYKQP